MRGATDPRTAPPPHFGESPISDPRSGRMEHISAPIGRVLRDLLTRSGLSPGRAADLLERRTTDA